MSTKDMSARNRRKGSGKIENCCKTFFITANVITGVK